MALPATQFRTLRPTAAVAVLLVTAVSIAALLPLAFGYVDPPSAHPGAGDLALYRNIVERLHGGEAYYPAAHAELQAGGYGTLSVLNWRTPLLPWLLSLFPSVAAAQTLLWALAAAAGGWALTLAARQGGWALGGALAPLLLISLAASLVPGSVLYSEYSAGMLILLSASAYGLGQRRLGFGAAVLALFIRELAAPYVLVCAALAWRDRRYGEMWGWLVALLAYAAYYFWHAQMVWAQLGPDDFAQPGGWLRFGGALFVLSTAAFNGIMTALPMWLTAVTLPLALLGLLAWPGTAGRRIALAVFAYLVLFAVFGAPLNAYWGALYTPLLTLGLPWAAPALRDLFRVLAAGRLTGARG